MTIDLAAGPRGVCGCGCFLHEHDIDAREGAYCTACTAWCASADELENTP